MNDDSRGKLAFEDRPTSVRTGEELDTNKLGAWLNDVTGLSGDIEVQQFPSGHSNLTYLVRVGDRELVLRRPPFGAAIKSAHDMGREHSILKALSSAWNKAPAPVACCEDESVLGCTFYVVERVHGLILRKDPPLDFDFGANNARRLSEAFVDTLVELHAIDASAVGLSDLGRPVGYVERQVTGWLGRYAKSKTDEIGDMDRVSSWLMTQPPFLNASASGGMSVPTLLHNDYKYDNLVLDPDDVGTVRAVLDWEMATRGDPLMDLGTALCYWVDPDDDKALLHLRFGPTNAPGTLDREALVQRYASATGRSVDDIAFYYVFGLFKTAVVVQQIYARFVAGHTTDKRFAQMHHAVAALAAQAVRVVESGRLDVR